MPFPLRCACGLLEGVVGIAAIVAPAVHLLTDAMEWYQHGFSTPQLWLNYAAFVPLSWLLLGLYAIHDPKPGAMGLLGALIYGAAFTYFAFTSLYALAERVPDYATLWLRLGRTYTMHGVLMIVGGLMFAASALRAGWLPRNSLLLFAAGLVINLIVGILPLPEMVQTAGSAVRNIGLMLIGHAILSGRTRPVS